MDFTDDDINKILRITGHDVYVSGSPDEPAICKSCGWSGVNSDVPAHINETRVAAVKTVLSEIQNTPSQLPGVRMIETERRRQITDEGWTAAHDDEEEVLDGLALAASCYAMPSRIRSLNLDHDGMPVSWPWHAKYWKPTPFNRKRELVKAGALIAAELDRLLRLENRQS